MATGGGLVSTDPDVPARPSRRPRQSIAIVTAGVLVLAAVVAAVVANRSNDDDHQTADLTVTWGGSEAHPSCSYSPQDHTVDAKLTIDGTAPKPEEVTVTVTAYADENTSVPVGSSSRTVHVEGTVHMELVLTISVEATPHVGEDDETACRLATTS